MHKNNYLGSCLCGQVEFKIQGVLESFFLCHCKYCQKDTGSAHSANLFSTN
ncbi:MAG: GFA family protein, partial [Pseudobdellovibrio sp.]